ncbi:serine/threonine protein kinase [Sphaerisporangium perillae]|uniref:serine/threonine protein kinase n=1 Tax=Sphaerisporangium perillae TaxID=2935860 RepID=UPI00200C7782|nr:serine/threonine-protein kinase [Sphaerisporangium perillae]
MQPLSAGDPQEIGPYRVVGRLGAGGMGLVYAGVDGAGRRVAVKLVHEALSTDLEFRRRFSREISVLTEVDGACVARVLGSDSGTERPWLATEFIAGPTLEQHVRAEGPLTGDALYGLAAGLAEALVAMHAVDVVHRDLKPSNVILSPQGPRLIDFGIAKVLDGTSMTHTGTLIGSPGWISPEEYGEGPAGTPADVYGWAMLLLFAATGEAPYGTGRPEVLAYRVREETPDLTAVPEGLRELGGHALDKDPEKRPAADDVLAAVTRAWRGEEYEQEPAAPDITSFIQRTWVMPQNATSIWPEAAAPVALPGPGTFQVSVVPQGPGELPSPATSQVMIVARRRGGSWLHAYVATAVAVTLIAVTAIIVNSVSERSIQVAATTASTSATAPRSTPASTTTTSTPTPTLAKTAVKKPRFKGKAVSFKGIKMTLPKGWRMLEVDKDYACIESPRSRGTSGPWDFVCRPDSMVIQLKSTKDDWPGFGIEDARFGFLWGQHVPCLAGGTVARDPYGSYSSTSGEAGLYYGIDPYRSRLVHSGLAKMGDGRKAFYRQWQVACDVNVNQAYTMKIWHLPQSKVSLYVLSALPADAKGYRQIIASADLLGYKHAAKL